MNKLVAIIPFYNEFKALQRLLMHLTSMKMPSILCDGRFHNFQKIKDSDFSTDGSRFLVHGFKDSTLIKIGPCNIDEKFNKLFQESASQGYSHALLLGCDEYIEGDSNLLQKNLESFDQTKPMLIRVPFKEHKAKLDKPPNFIERIFFMPGLIRAGESYKSFYSMTDKNNETMIPMQSNPTSVKGITIHHDNTIRTKERNELMVDYQSKIKEKKF